jgi:hypothetical protein
MKRRTSSAKEDSDDHLKRFYVAERPTHRIEIGQGSSRAGVPSGQKVLLLHPAGQTITRSIPVKAEVALEYPDKFYVGTFDRTSRFDAHLDSTGLSLVLERPGEENVRKSIHMHLNYDLFAQILKDVAATVAAMDPEDMAHRAAVAQGAQALVQALNAKRQRRTAEKPNRKGRLA